MQDGQDSEGYDREMQHYEEYAIVSPVTSEHKIHVETGLGAEEQVFQISKNSR